MAEKFNARKFMRDLMFRQVRFSRAYERTIEHTKGSLVKRAWVAHDVEPQVGWVVGATWLQTGVRHPGWGGSGSLLGEDYDDYEPPTFEETAPRQLVYLVTTWPTKRPFKVPPGAIEVLAEPVEPYYCDKDTRRLMSEQMAKESHLWPRDERGRFRSGE